MVVTFGVLVMTQGSLVFASVPTLRVWGSVCLCEASSVGFVA